MGEASMVVGAGWVDIMVEDSRSLKGKRKVVRSVIDRVRHRFGASVAEVGDLEMWGRARIGFSMVSRDGRHLNSLLDKIVDLIEDSGHCVVGSDFDMMHF